MPNQSLVDLTERTATADSDLIHVNSGGSDYKQTKANFTSDLAKEISFSTSSTLTSQVDALSVGGYYGFIASYGHQSATGMPYDVNFFVTVQKYDSNNCTVHAIARGTDPRKWTINKANSWGSWIEDPSRDEISALNNSFANRFVNLGSVSATNLKTALIAAFDKLSVHDNPVIGTYSYSGAWMFWAHKYTGDLHGMMLAITYYPSSTSILLLNRSNGVDTVRAVNLSGEI